MGHVELIDHAAHFIAGAEVCVCNEQHQKRCGESPEPEPAVSKEIEQHQEADEPEKGNAEGHHWKFPWYSAGMRLDQVLHAIAFLAQFLVRRIHPGTTEIVDRKSLQDMVRAALAG